MGMHPPKTETFDVAAGTNTDPKGIVRPVDTYQVRPWGLYLARAADHQQFDYIESWLLPQLGLRATIFHFTPGHERDQDRYVDIGDYRRDGEVWLSTDHYLDLVVRGGRHHLAGHRRAPGRPRGGSPGRLQQRAGGSAGSGGGGWHRHAQPRSRRLVEQSRDAGDLGSDPSSVGRNPS